MDKYKKKEKSSEELVDLELTERARKIQDELRLNELAELAFEAERAALAGRKKFVGNASVFGERDFCRSIGQAAVTTENDTTVHSSIVPFISAVCTSPKLEINSTINKNSQENLRNFKVLCHTDTATDFLHEQDYVPCSSPTMVKNEQYTNGLSRKLLPPTFSFDENKDTDHVMNSKERFMSNYADNSGHLEDLQVLCPHQGRGPDSQDLCFPEQT